MISKLQLILRMCKGIMHYCVRKQKHTHIMMERK